MERAARSKHELSGGEIFAMAGAEYTLVLVRLEWMP